METVLGKEHPSTMASMNNLEPVLQQRYAFFDGEKGSVVTFLNFHKLGFGLLLFTLAVFIIHANFSNPRLRTSAPDLQFRTYITNIRKDKNGVILRLTIRKSIDRR
jgi:hypothetical protein